MRRMYSESELTNLIKNYVTSGDGVFNIKKLTITADESVSYNGLEVSGNVILNDNVYTDGDVFDITGGIVGIGGSIHSINDNNKITIFGSDIEIVDGMDGEGGNLTAKTLEQTQANYVLDDTNFTFSEISGISFHKQYCRIEAINNILYIIANFDITNVSAESITLGNSMNLKIENLSQEISKKIYTALGNDLDTIPANNTGITATQAYTDNGNAYTGYYQGKVVSLYQQAGQKNKIVCNIRDYGNIASNATHNITFRCFLTLI